MKGPQDLMKDVETILSEGNWDAASKLLVKVISQIGEDPKDNDSKKFLSQTLRLKAFADSRRGEHKEAIHGAKKAMNISKDIGDLEGEADALRRLGYIHWQKADYLMALEFYNSALEKANVAEARKLIGRVKIELGNTYDSMGNSKMAQRVYKDAIDILEKEKDTHELARALNNIASTFMHDKKLKDALGYLTRCITVCDTSGNLIMKGWAANNMGDCHIQLGKPKAALPFLKMAERIMKDTDDKVGLAITYMNYGMTYTALKDWDRALVSFERAETTEGRLQMPALRAEIFREHGKLLTAMKENDKALHYLKKSLDLFKDQSRDKDAAEIKDLMSKIEE
jgi:tetratricopeptide (TPR) repeat protein